MVDDVVIIGGGASGLCAAVRLKQLKPDISVRILETLPRVGKKLSVTGNGRCNITNKKIDISNFHGLHPQFCNYALKKYNIDDYCNFFKKIGVEIIFEGDKAYPSSLQASSVVDCLRFAADEAGVVINTDTKVTNIQIKGSLFKVSSDNVSFLAKNLVIATGLLSGGDKYGCDGEMIKLLQKSGFKTVETSPAIVQLKTNNDITKQLKGIKVNALASLKTNDKLIKSEYGEVLFCDYGLSGPPILQISGHTSNVKTKCFVELDIMPYTDTNELFLTIKNRMIIFKTRTFEDLFTGMINKRLGQIIVKLSGMKLSDRVDFDKTVCLKLVDIIKHLKFEVTGTMGFLNSQVTQGGLDTTQFIDQTMMSKTYGGLYATGEILDIDGDCGGYNLSWAWSSALCAADSIIQRQD